MTLIALISPEPGLRYRAHLWALQQLGVPVEFVEVAGPGVLFSKVARQARLAAKKGLRDYVKWRRERHEAAPTRAEVTQELELRLSGQPYVHAPLPVKARFRGFDASLVRHLNERKPEYILQCGAWLLPEHFITQVPTLLNMHPGILPGIRGLDPVFWALYYGREDWLGSTLHIIDSGIDTGRPLLRRKLRRFEGDSIVDLIERQTDLEMDLIRIFFTNQPGAYTEYDEGGLQKSVYKSSWSREQYDALKAAGWWGANLGKPQVTEGYAHEEQPIFSSVPPRSSSEPSPAQPSQ